MRPPATGTTDRDQGGFTLAEMMVAMGILMFAATSLIAVLAVGVSMRREAELRSQATRMADAVAHHLAQEVLPAAVRARADAGDPGAPPEPVTVSGIPGYPGLVYHVDFRTDAEHPDLVLASVVFSWLARGESSVERFQRVLRVEEPFPRRVSRHVLGPARSDR